MNNIFHDVSIFSYLSESSFAWNVWQPFASFTLASSGLLASPPAMNTDQGYQLSTIYGELLQSCDRRQGGHMTSEV